MTLGAAFPQEEKRLPCDVLGKNIGTCSGWDSAGDNSVYFYDFIPNPRGMKLLRTNIAVFRLFWDWEEGIFSRENPENPDEDEKFKVTWAALDPTDEEKAQEKSLLENL